jgi:hypothetical protein
MKIIRIKQVVCFGAWTRRAHVDIFEAGALKRTSWRGTAATARSKYDDGTRQSATVLCAPLGTVYARLAARCGRARHVHTARCTVTLAGHARYGTLLGVVTVRVHSTAGMAVHRYGPCEVQFTRKLQRRARA